MNEYQAIGSLLDDNASLVKQAKSLQSKVDDLKEMIQETVAKYQAEIDRQRDLLDEQKRTIIALNDCIGGEGSTTTENLIVVTRLQQRVADLMQTVAILEKKNG